VNTSRRQSSKSQSPLCLAKGDESAFFGRLCLRFQPSPHVTRVYKRWNVTSLGRHNLYAWVSSPPSSYLLQRQFQSFSPLWKVGFAVEAAGQKSAFSIAVNNLWRQKKKPLNAPDFTLGDGDNATKISFVFALFSFRLRFAPWR